MGQNRTVNHLMATRPRATAAPRTSVPVAQERQLRFACAECELDITVADEGRDRLVEGRVNPAGVLQVVHERLSDRARPRWTAAATSRSLACLVGSVASCWSPATGAACPPRGRCSEPGLPGT